MDLLGTPVDGGIVFLQPRCAEANVEAADVGDIEGEIFFMRWKAEEKWNGGVTDGACTDRLVIDGLEMVWIFFCDGGDGMLSDETRMDEDAFCSRIDEGADSELRCVLVKEAI